MKRFTVDLVGSIRVHEEFTVLPSEVTSVGHGLDKLNLWLQ